MKQDIIFNYVPPAYLSMPAAAFSVLKSYLKARGVIANVYYWNFKLAELQANFLWSENIDILENETNNLLLFYNYLSIKENDKSTYDKIKSKLMTIKPHFIGRGEDLFDKHMKQYAELLDKTIDEIIDEICSEEIKYYGFSANLYQWVCSTIIAEKIKAKYPNSVLILGGIGTQKAAVKFVDNFNHFDYALWGEGENSLFLLISMLENNVDCDIDSISNLAYRKSTTIATSENRKVSFSDLSSGDVRPDYSDFFSQKLLCKYLENMECAITVESSRGCHWNKCHFCYLNTGYRNRLKDINAFVDEVRDNIEKYEICQFNFLDNDIINNDFERFDHLLTKLIDLKKICPEFRIGMAEIITKGLKADIIRKMSLAGFERVQIGYESPSDAILKKIEKKNSFSSNILFIKYAIFYKINVGGANIIMGLLEETDSDIIEAISNLHFLRFFLKYGQFNHSQTTLAVCSASRYYKRVNVKSGEWIQHMMFSSYFPDKYLNDDELDIIEVSCSKINPLWDDFMQVEKYYLTNFYTYKLIYNDSSVIYREYFNDTSINELEFELKSLDWLILNTANKEVVSFEKLYLLAKAKIDFALMEIEVINAIEDLKHEGLLYSSDDYNEIISIINIETLI